MGALCVGKKTVDNRDSLRLKDEHQSFMDKASYNSKEAIEDSTRESLIAISYGVPDTDQTSEMSPANIQDGVSVKGGGDSEEKYRSKLISISNLESPEVKANSQQQPLPEGN